MIFFSREFNETQIYIALSIDLLMFYNSFYIVRLDDFPMLINHNQFFNYFDCNTKYDDDLDDDDIVIQYRFLSFTKKENGKFKDIDDIIMKP